MIIKNLKLHIYIVESYGGKKLYEGSFFGCKNYIKINKNTYEKNK